MKKTFTSVLKTCFRNILVPETCRSCLHRLCGPPHPIQLAGAAGCGTFQNQGECGSCSSAGAAGQGWLELGPLWQHNTAQLSQLEGRHQPGHQHRQCGCAAAALPAGTWLKGEEKRGEGICNNLISNNQQLNYTKELNQRLDGKYSL